MAGVWLPCPELDYQQSMAPVTLADCPKGRRLRTLVRLVQRFPASIGAAGYMARAVGAAGYMARAEGLRWLADPYASIPLRPKTTDVPDIITEKQVTRTHANATLHVALQDLAYEIGEDLQEACEFVLGGSGYFAGVDEGIEPVPDEHVELVIWGLQREIDREPRYSRINATEKLPPVQLGEFPWAVQRAIVERRRLRFAQWGIGREEWESGRWSLWNVPLDPDYQSRRELRGLAEANDARRPS